MIVFAIQGRTVVQCPTYPRRHVRTSESTWETLMADYEVMHIPVAPPTNLDANLARSVANVINRSQVNKKDLITRRVDPRIGFQISRVDIPCNRYYIRD